ncbi:MAG: pilus assembly protein [Anaerolineales bacterium]|nr:pilus assembly protein [Anaerolineales bacterium]
MINFIKKIASKYKLRKTKLRAQSLVEFAIALPLLILLLLVMVELGFVLNTYLSLLDATRLTARIYSNINPFQLTVNPTPPPAKLKADKLTYYSDAAQLLIDTLNSNSYEIKFDETSGALDDVLISVITVDVDENANTTKLIRHPSGANYWAFNPDSVLAGYKSHYDDDTALKSYMSPPIDAGILIVEVYYSYEGTLQIPTWFWSISFATDGKPLMLYASSVMSISSAKPDLYTPTPHP